MKIRNLKPCVIKTLVIFLLIGLASCGGNDETEDIEPKDPFLGKWEIVSAEGSFASENIGTTYEFNESKVSISKGGIKSSYGYLKTSSQITVKLSELGSPFEDTVYDYTLSGSVLKMDDTNSDQKFTLNKK